MLSLGYHTLCNLNLRRTQLTDLNCLISIFRPSIFSGSSACTPKASLENSCGSSFKGEGPTMAEAATVWGPFPTWLRGKWSCWLPMHCCCSRCSRKSTTLARLHGVARLAMHLSGAVQLGRTQESLHKVSAYSVGYPYWWVWPLLPGLLDAEPASSR